MGLNPCMMFSITNLKARVVVDMCPEQCTLYCPDMQEDGPLQATLSCSKILTDPSKVADQLDRFWLPIWHALACPVTDQDMLDSQDVTRALPAMPELTLDWSLAQWKKAIASLKPNAARGYDAISAAELAMLPDCLIDRL